MVPAALTLVEAWPMTASGKIDRPALLSLESVTATVKAKPTSAEVNSKLGSGNASNLVPATGNFEALILKHVHSVIGQDGVQPTDDLFRVGLTSLSSITLIKLLQDEMALSPPLPFTLFSRFPTATDAAREIQLRWKTPQTPAKARSMSGETTPAVQLLGQACRLPGHVSTPARLWESLCVGANCLTMAPERRSPAHLTLPFLAGFILDLGSHDHEDLWASKAPNGIDQNMCLLLDSCCAALADGEPPVGERSGVFCAVDTQGFTRPLQRWAVPRVVASCLGFGGPIANIDNAECASGYLAIHHALESAVNGSCDFAVVGSTRLFYGLSSLDIQILHPGPMRPFDAQSDGTLHAEASCAIALGQGRRAHCAVIGWKANCTSPLLPLTFADADRMLEAAESNFMASNPSGRSVVAHPHGMGNPASDIPELMALLTVAERTNCPLVVVGHKANIGHTHFASGLVAVAMSALDLQHRVAPRHINISQLSQPARAPSFRLPTAQGMMLPAQDILHASISGTSVSGDNVHLMLCDAVATHQAIEVAELDSQTRVTRIQAAEIEIRKQEYLYSPPRQELHSMTPEELQSVKNFQIERKGFGSMIWIEPVDLRGADFKSVQICRGGGKLDPGELPMLNCSCLVTAEGMLPNPPLSGPRMRVHAGRMRRKLDKLPGCEWVGYDPRTGQLKFRISHFPPLAAGLDPLTRSLSDRADDEVSVDGSETTSLQKHSSVAERKEMLAEKKKRLAEMKQRLAGTSPPEDFSGEWVKTAVSGDPSRFLEELGYSWIARKAAAKFEYGVGDVQVIDHQGDVITIENVPGVAIGRKPVKQVCRVGCGLCDAVNLVGDPIKLELSWTERGTKGRTVLKNGTVLGSERWIDEQGRMVIKSDRNGVIMQNIYTKRMCA